VCRPPRVTAAGIRAAAASAVKLAGRREPAREPGGYRVEVDVDAAQLAQAAAVVPTVQRTGERSVAYSSGTAWDMIRCFKAVTTLISAAIENAYG
jgi:D-amino peptidase